MAHINFLQIGTVEDVSHSLDVLTATKLDSVVVEDEAQLISVLKDLIDQVGTDDFSFHVISFEDETISPEDDDVIVVAITEKEDVVAVQAAQETLGLTQRFEDALQAIVTEVVRTGLLSAGESLTVDERHPKLLGPTELLGALSPLTEAQETLSAMQLTDALAIDDIAAILAITPTLESMDQEDLTPTSTGTIDSTEEPTVTDAEVFTIDGFDQTGVLEQADILPDLIERLQQVGIIEKDVEDVVMESVDTFENTITLPIEDIPNLAEVPISLGIVQVSEEPTTDALDETAHRLRLTDEEVPNASEDGTTGSGEPSTLAIIESPTTDTSEEPGIAEGNADAPETLLGIIGTEANTEAPTSNDAHESTGVRSETESLSQDEVQESTMSIFGLQDATFEGGAAERPDGSLKEIEIDATSSKGRVEVSDFKHPANLPDQALDAILYNYMVPQDLTDDVVRVAWELTPPNFIDNWHFANDPLTFLDDEVSDADLSEVNGPLGRRASSIARFGQGVELDGADEAVQCVDAALTGSGEAGVMMAFEVDALGTRQRLVRIANTSGSSKSQFELFIESDDTLVFNDNGGAVDATTGTLPSAGEYALYVRRNASDNVRIKVFDSTGATVLDENFNRGGDSDDGTAEFTLGDNPDASGSDLDGAIYEAHLWKGNNLPSDGTLDQVADPTDTTYEQTLEGGETAAWFFESAWTEEDISGTGVNFLHNTTRGHRSLGCVEIDSGGLGTSEARLKKRVTGIATGTDRIVTLSAWHLDFQPGVAAGEVDLQVWDGDPASGGTMLGETRMASGDSEWTRYSLVGQAVAADPTVDASGNGHGLTENGDTVGGASRRSPVGKFGTGYDLDGDGDFLSQGDDAYAAEDDFALFVALSSDTAELVDSQTIIRSDEDTTENEYFLLFIDGGSPNNNLHYADANNITENTGINVGGQGYFAVSVRAETNDTDPTQRDVTIKVFDETGAVIGTHTATRDKPDFDGTSRIHIGAQPSQDFELDGGIFDVQFWNGDITTLPSQAQLDALADPNDETELTDQTAYWKMEHSDFVVADNVDELWAVIHANDTSAAESLNRVVDDIRLQVTGLGERVILEQVAKTYPTDGQKAYHLSLETMEAYGAGDDLRDWGWVEVQSVNNVTDPGTVSTDKANDGVQSARLATSRGAGESVPAIEIRRELSTPSSTIEASGAMNLDTQNSPASIFISLEEGSTDLVRLRVSDAVHLSIDGVLGDEVLEDPTVLDTWYSMKVSVSLDTIRVDVFKDGTLIATRFADRESPGADITGMSIRNAGGTEDGGETVGFYDSIRLQSAGVEDVSAHNITRDEVDRLIAWVEHEDNGDAVNKALVESIGLRYTFSS